MTNITPRPAGGNSPGKISLVSVFDGDGVCRGFIINRGKLGREAFNAEQHSIGMFETVPAAVNALLLVEEGG